ncbi:MULTISPECIES: hypothetical protein [unclassified Chryseobacterium]|uniref:hypothetical protein n=1 Tax=unclassified Chryseobacterium TaxID=2593645 RepID=UPI000FBEB1FD|nr:hypothetical protein [Chryseobacterium sp. BIGb0232]MCS4303310.1 hypothetical protein [Chryseobacterium sp. BIGb0232]ROS11416.1 hypothetical protein EDF65_3828 [Chryseobacterium nakagawai]
MKTGIHLQFKYFASAIVLLCILSCEKTKINEFHSEKKSIEFTLQNFPMLAKNFEKVKEVNLDSLTISLYRNPKKEDYDEILVFSKNKKFYAVPFFSNMYFDYWNFDNEDQKQLYPKTNSTFEKQIKNTVSELNLTQEEFGLLIEELMKSVLNAETNLDLKPKIFENYIYSTYRVDQYKVEESDSCLARTKRLYKQILIESEKIIRYNQFFLDARNGRVYEFINESRKRGEWKFKIKTYRIDCFSYPLSI